MRKAAPPADALYSSASPGAPWLVSDPIARPYFIILDKVRPIVVWIAAVPALQANSKSAAVRTGAELIASATIVAVALIAIIGDRPYLTPVKQRARSLVDPYIRR